MGCIFTFVFRIILLVQTNLLSINRGVLDTKIYKCYKSTQIALIFA